MVVIATNNGYIYLKELLASMEFVEMCNEEIIIVDTMSDDTNHLEFLNEIESLYPSLNIKVVTTPYRKFDTGAYIYAYQNYISDYYIFLHDSVTIKNVNFIKHIKDYLKKYNVVSYNSFQFLGNGGSEWLDFFKKNTGEETYKMGIFGPMFACNRIAFDAIDVDRLILPQTKNQQACYEGIWYTIFDKNDIEIFSIEMFDNIFNSKYLNKKIIHRN
jgi:hypothetical protein